MTGIIGWREYRAGRRAARPDLPDWEHLADYWDLCARWWEERLAEMEQAHGLDAILQQRTIDDTCTWKDQYIERAEQLRRYMRLSDE